MEKFKPTSVVIAWDNGIPEFRRRAVPEYKAGRHKDEDPEQWEDFNRQMVELHSYALPMMGVVNVRSRGIEADDIMYHTAKMLDGNFIMVSSDKDILQTVADNVKVFNPSRNKLYTPEMLSEEIGIDYKHYVHWRALQGDASDGIPGVYGIGEKTATKLFKEFGSLTAIENAANGSNPAGTLQPKIANAMLLFGSDRIIKNVYVMALYADRAGSRFAIMNAVHDCRPADKKRIVKYMMSNGFSSLMENTGRFMNLQIPELLSDVRIPIKYASYRKAI
jgi:5'-3' exonuclease